MNIRNSLLILTIVQLFFSSHVYPQSAYKYRTDTITWRIPYLHSFGQTENFGNDILEELAKDYLKPPAYINVSVRFREEISLRPLRPSFSQVIIALSDFSLSGNLWYRNFPMSDVLMPSLLRLSLKSSDKLDTGVYVKHDFEGKDPCKNARLIFRINELAIDSSVDTIIRGNVYFRYSEADWQQFYARKSLIDDYYASASLLDSLALEEQSWNMRDPRQLPYNFIRLGELVRVLDLINDRNFGERLISRGGDPGRLPMKRLNLYKTSRTCLFNLLETIENSGTIHFSFSPDSISDFFIGRLMRYIHLSSLMDNIQGEIYQDFLNTYYTRHVSENDPGMLQSILILIYPGARPDTLLPWYSENLMEAYRRKAKELAASGKYSEAVQLMENARRMASADPNLKNHNGWENLMRESVNGIYNSYAGIASSSLESGNVSFAMEYLQKAEQYRKLYPLYINSDSIYRRVYRSIFIGQLDYCSKLLANEDFDAALECLNSCDQAYETRVFEILAPDIAENKARARKGLIAACVKNCLKALKQELPDTALVYFDRGVSIAGSLPGASGNIKVLDSLAPVIAVIRVTKINALASAYFRQRQFARAVLQFEQALKISTLYSIPVDAVADSVYRQSSKQWLLERISKEQRLIWNDKPDSADGFIQLALETAKSKGLSNDPDILKALSLFRSGIVRHSCDLMQDSLVIFNIRAGRCFAIRNFNRGVKILRYAKFQAGRIPSCDFDLAYMQDSITKYKDPAEYQEKMEKVNADMVSGEYERGLQTLAENEKFYKLKRIDHFGISLTSVYDYAMLKANPFISIEAFNYYLVQGDPAEAMRYLILMHVQGISESKTLIYQEKLASVLALHDKLAYQKTDPREIVLRYTSSGTWMNRFREIYIETWEGRH